MALAALAARAAAPPLAAVAPPASPPGPAPRLSAAFAAGSEGAAGAGAGGGSLRLEALAGAALGAAAGVWVSRARRRPKPTHGKDAVAREARRRDALAGAGAAVVLGPPTAEASSAAEPPTVARKAADGVYVFDQAYGIPGLGVGANIPIRMTALSLEGGGYLLYNPCNPTQECLQQLADFGLSDIRHIVLGTIAVEHKYYGPQWAARFPKAQVWISPRTFSWPVDFGAYLPIVGFPRGKELHKVPKDSTQAPWHSQGIDHLQLTVDYAPRTVFEETVMYHRPSGTFVCTDMLIGIADDPPEILTRSPYREGLLWFSRDTPLDKVDVESPVTVRDGYQKSILLLNNINPRSLLSVAAGDLAVPEQVGLALQSPQKELGYFGWYPCNWQETDSPCASLDKRETPGKATKSFSCRPGWRGEWARLTKGVADTGLQVPSFVAELQISRDPEAVRSFADEIARRWPDLKQVVPSHFNAPLPATADGVRKAIAGVADGPPGPPARTADLSAILNFRDYLEANDLIYKPASGRGQWRPV